MNRPRRAPFHLVITGEAGREQVGFLRKHLPAARRLIKASVVGELSLALVGDETMAALHVQFMGIDGPTDVLSFPLDFDAEGRVSSGEVVVCLPEARRQAERHQIPVERELLLYALHGLLHLSGHDDRTAAGFRAMHRAEDEILMQLGIPATFSPKNVSKLRTSRKPARRAAAQRSKRGR
jgi:probable rRNA maturation factor